MPVTATTPVSAISGTAFAASTSDAGTSTTDYDAFLRLLVAEIRNQDPLNPSDATQYVSQLATFSNVEQAVNTNAKLDALLSSFTLSQADAIIGHRVTSADGSISGAVDAVRIFSDGIVAVLDDGSELLLGPGVTVSRSESRSASDSESGS